jgi:bifunctional non-homologous end joining protein LigD
LYRGKVGTGWNDTVAEEMREALAPLIRKTSPLDERVSKPKATWVECLCRRADEGLLRGSSFERLREDLTAVPPVGLEKRRRRR